MESLERCPEWWVIMLVPFRWVKEDFRCHSKEMPLQGVHNRPWELPEDPGLAAVSSSNLSRPCV